MTERNAPIEANRQMQFRIGINLVDVAARPFEAVST
jgi:hypothetical protein